MENIDLNTVETLLANEKRTRYLGAVGFRYESLRFPADEMHYRDNLSVNETVERLNRQGWLHPTARYHIPAIISQEQLSYILECLGIPPDVLLHFGSREPPEIQLPAGFKLECLHDWKLPSRAAASEFTWWTVDLYLEDIPRVHASR